GAAVDIDGRHVGPQNAHHAARHVLVAAADHQHAVHPLALHAGFNAVGDDLARNERVLHAFGAHRHAVGYGGRAEHLRIATGLRDRLNRGIGQLLQATVAGCDGTVTVGNAHHGLGEIGIGITQPVIHRTVGCPLGPFYDICRTPAS